MSNLDKALVLLKVMYERTSGRKPLSMREILEIMKEEFNSVISDETVLAYFRSFREQIGVDIVQTSKGRYASYYYRETPEFLFRKKRR